MPGSGYWHAEDALAYLRRHPEAGVCRDTLHGWWVTSRINDEHHPEAFRLHAAEGEKLRGHAALAKLQSTPHPDREVWVLREIP